MNDFDEVLAGPCEECGEPGQLRPDPFDADVNNQTTLVVLCDDCLQERVWEI